MQLPPKIPAKEIGMSSFPDGILKRSDSWNTILIKIITTAVVLINAEIPAVTTINIGAIKINGSMLSFFRPSLSHFITPFSSKPMATIIKHSTVMVAELEKPLIASSGETSCNSVREAIKKNAILSTVKYSVTNNTIVINMMLNTKIMSNSTKTLV